MQVVSQLSHFFARVLHLLVESTKHNKTERMNCRKMTCYRLTAADLKNIRVRVDCGEEHTGLTRVLFHETSHIIEYVEHYTPYVEDNIRELGIGVLEKGFACKVWKKYAVPFAQNEFPKRSELPFYEVGGRRGSSLSEAERIYEHLAQTPFCSLYGSKNWAEDFPEYMSWYYLTKVMQQPYADQVLRDDMVSYSYSPME